MKSLKTSHRLRLARQSDRDYAAELARLFLSQEPLPLDINEDGEEVYRSLDGDDLALTLQAFAREGTFATPPGIKRSVRAISINAHFRELRGQRDSYEEAVAKCADRFKCSETTVRNSLSWRNRIRLVRSGTPSTDANR